MSHSHDGDSQSQYTQRQDQDPSGSEQHMAVVQYPHSQRQVTVSTRSPYDYEYNTQQSSHDTYQHHYEYATSDMDVERGSVYNRRPSYEESSNRHRSSFRDGENTASFVRERRQELGGADHRFPDPWSDPTERWRRRAEYCISRFDARYSGEYHETQTCEMYVRYENGEYAEMRSYVRESSPRESRRSRRHSSRRDGERRRRT